MRARRATGWCNGSEHGLLQAIARVNRFEEGKDFGYIIDYEGVLGELDRKRHPTATGARPGQQNEAAWRGDDDRRGSDMGD